MTSYRIVILIAIAALAVVTVNSDKRQDEDCGICLAMNLPRTQDTRKPLIELCDHRQCGRKNEASNFY